jgi:hypothetical protein
VSVFGNGNFGGRGVGESLPGVEEMVVVAEVERGVALRISLWFRKYVVFQ